MSAGPRPGALARFERLRADRIEDGAVLRVVLDHPKGNVLSSAMMREIAAALAAHRDDPHLKLVFLRGAGGHFSFGASIEEHRRDTVGPMLREFHAFVRDLAACPVPVAALVEGRCLGGAFEMALVCHFVLAAADARFGCPEIRLGVFPPVLAAVGGTRLPAAIAERLVLTGEELDGRTLASHGLVTRVFEPGADPETALIAWYHETLAPLSAYALRVAVRAARDGSGLIAALGAPLDAAERRYLDRLPGSHDGNEGIEAFLERRPARWRDA
ncbi:MAG TPA: enoyl-CoA hydratase/isomerase family protein [Dongiaceae bacterium]|nr:enoyl-CoA hydratase/isomerase family protein [Dongiaceae bacterium]